MTPMLCSIFRTKCLAIWQSLAQWEILSHSKWTCIRKYVPPSIPRVYVACVLMCISKHCIGSAEQKGNAFNHGTKIVSLAGMSNFAFKMGQIWEKSETFKDMFQYILTNQIWMPNMASLWPRVTVQGCHVWLKVGQIIPKWDIYRIFFRSDFSTFWLELLK